MPPLPASARPEKFQVMTCEQGAQVLKQLSDTLTPSRQNAPWWQVTLSLPAGAGGTQNLGSSPLAAIAEHIRQALPASASYAVKPFGFKPQAIFSDVDATLIPVESLEVLATGKSFAAEITALTRQAMEGQLDFATALRLRVALFAGLCLTQVEAIAASIEPYPGVRELCRWCQQQGLPFYLVSGGFNPMLRLWAQDWGATAYAGNTLEVVGGKLSGGLCPPLIDGPGKRHWLLETCKEKRFDPHQVVAMGDGANDLGMLQAAGLRVGFNPKNILDPHLHVRNQTGSHYFLLDFLRW